MPLTGAGRPWTPPVSHGLLHRFLHRLRVCIYAVDQGRFNPRALVHPTSLYKQAPTPGFKALSHLIKSSEPEALVSLELLHILEHSYLG
jgi:hypothetical protein